MKKSSRKILSVSRIAHTSQKTDETNDLDFDDKIVVGVIDLALPCRDYWVDYKTSNSEKFSPTLEFLLRLVHSAPGIERDQVASFFGYNEAETAYAINEAGIHGYISETDGRLNLTIAGRGLFENSKDGPRLFSVQKKTDKVAFDLLSLAPTRREMLSVKSLPELPISSTFASKSAANEIQANRLKRFFGELGLSRSRSNEEPCSLYSVDDVRADSRFQESIPVSLIASRLQPSNVIPDLSEWRPDHEVADRLEIEREVSKYVDSMKTASRSGDGDEAYDILLKIFPSFLEKYANRKGLDVEGFWREITKKDNSPRKNRKTIPLAGSLFTKTNSKTLGAVVDYGLSQVPLESRPEQLSYCWIAPQIPTWGASSIARSTNELISAKINRAQRDAEGNPSVSNVCIFPGKHPFHLRDVFDYVEDLDNTKLPRELEVLYIPGILVAASVHAPIALKFGFPTPLGAISFDREVVEKTHEFLSESLGNSGSDRIDRFLRGANSINCRLSLD